MTIIYNAAVTMSHNVKETKIYKNYTTNKHISPATNGQTKVSLYNTLWYLLV